MMTALPVLFVSHGAPTFVLEPGVAGANLNRLGRRLVEPTKPSAIVVVSAHWQSSGLRVSAAPMPETIHDFGGFPREMYEMQYPAPGAPDLANKIVGLFKQAGIKADIDPRRGLDHGAWVPLKMLFPKADIPVLQVSIPYSYKPEQVWAMGRALAPLRNDNIFLMGSGSITHNLMEWRSHTHGSNARYAVDFEAWVRKNVVDHNKDALCNYLDNPDGARAHPSPDHYLPLLFAAGAASQDGKVEVLEGDMRFGMLSMDSFVFH